MGFEDVVERGGKTGGKKENQKCKWKR